MTSSVGPGLAASKDKMPSSQVSQLSGVFPGTQHEAPAFLPSPLLCLVNMSQKSFSDLQEATGNITALLCKIAILLCLATAEIG